MVKQTRHIFDLTDIESVHLQCGHCGREAVQSIESTGVPKTCPFCFEDWEVDLLQGNRGPNYSLVLTMQGLLKQDTSLMTIRFEIDASD